MKHYVVFFSVLLTTVCANAQTVEGPHYILDYRFFAPTAQALYNGDLFVSYREIPGLYVVDTVHKSATVVDGLAQLQVARLLHVGNTIVCVTSDGSLLWLDNKTEQWRPIDTFRCMPFVVIDGMYVLSEGKVLSLKYNGDSWNTSLTGTFNEPTGPMPLFVMLGDTIVFASRGSNFMTVLELDGGLARSIVVQGSIDNLLLLGDGAIAISTGGQVSQVLRKDSIGVGNPSQLLYQGAGISLSEPTTLIWNNDYAMTGSFNSLLPFNNDPMAGLYTVYSADSVVRMTDLDSIIQNVSLVTFHKDTWVLSTRSHICVVGGDKVSHTQWFADSSFGFSEGISFTPSGQPFRCGTTSYGSVSRPTIFPNTASSSVSVLPITEKRMGLLTRYIQLEGGPEVAFCSFGIFAKNGNEPFTQVATSKSNLEAKDIDIVNDSTIVSHSNAMQFLISQDKGLTWKSVYLKGYLWRMTRVLAAGTTMYAHASGDIWAIDLNNLADSITVPQVHIPFASLQRLFSCTPEVVQAISVISTLDSATKLNSSTKLVLHKWNHVTSNLDSASFTLDKPIAVGFPNVIARGDTAYVWHAGERRLVAVTYNGIAFDTTLPPVMFGAYADLLSFDVSYDNQSNPWLSVGQTMLFKFNPGKSIISSVQDYYEHLYISTIRPNPVTSSAHVTLGRFATAIEAGARLYLADLRGAVVRDFTNQLTAFPGPVSTQDVQINVDGLPWGMYFIVIENRQGKSIGKVVVTP